jgi:hypothetical protein
MKSVTNLATNLRDAAGQYPARDAVRLDDTVLTYAVRVSPTVAAITVIGGHLIVVISW